MVKKALQSDLAHLSVLSDKPITAKWLPQTELNEITSTKATTKGRSELLEALVKCSQITI